MNPNSDSSPPPSPEENGDIEEKDINDEDEDGSREEFAQGDEKGGAEKVDVEEEHECTTPEDKDKDKEKKGGGEFTTEELKRIDEWFHALCLPDNTLNLGCFTKLFEDVPELAEPSLTEIQRFFSLFLTKEGSIEAERLTYDEFLCGIHLVLMGSQEEREDFLFRMNDVDGDGVFSRSDYRRYAAINAWESLRKVKNRIARIFAKEKESFREVLDRFEEGSLQGLEEGIDTFFANADVDGDGQVSLEDYRKHLQLSGQTQRSLRSLRAVFCCILPSLKQEALEIQNEEEEYVERMCEDLRECMDDKKTRKKSGGKNCRCVIV
eukprot:TRINITY_DN43319_c0_g1_i1.p1 TRINITY_DN43319_c0_g1~~TRINITY_DN43319_c0_g1_i1.p1  ORF type:complete len:367 (-),score=103.99 TRINITY_DN43319_c0_g1_i1:127-1092(-)